ncbi:MAG: hypothetical protein ACXWFQ_06670, partial [Thermoanaerobaculia bacterium]
AVHAAGAEHDALHARGRENALFDLDAREAHGKGREGRRLVGHAVARLGWQPTHGGFEDEVETYYAAWKAAQG